MENYIYGCICTYCEKPLLVDQITRDHIIPRSKKGKAGRRSKNAAICCFGCNRLKGNKSLVVFYYFLIKKSRKTIIDEEKNKLIKISQNTKELFNVITRERTTAEYYRYKKIKKFNQRLKESKKL